MKNKIYIVIILLVFLFCHSIKAQTNSPGAKKYVIFTFEIVHLKVKRYYYWITPQDSIDKRNAFEVFPLYTEEYSKDILERCMAGDSIDIFAASTATNFNFSDSYRSEVKSLLSLISTNKIKIQSIKKKWTQNSSEEINIYASPIIGEFCNCLQIHGKPTYGFKGIVYLPVASFEYDQSYWNSKNSNIVRYVDYSYVEYSSHYPSSMHGNSNNRVKGKIQAF